MLSVLIGILVYSSWSVWTGGYCYGCRFASDLAPWVFVLVAVLLRRFRESNRFKLFFGALILLGFVANVPGAIVSYGHWCLETESLQSWSLSRSQVYCTWREMLGLENEQLLIQLTAQLRYQQGKEPWVSIYYSNPTRQKHVTLCAAVWGRPSPNGPFKFYKLYQSDILSIERGASDTLKLPLARAFDECECPHIRIDFAFVKSNSQKASNVASISLARPNDADGSQ